VWRARPWNHTGAGRPDRFVESSFARQLAEIEAGHRPPRIAVGALDSVRDFLHVEDVVDAYLALLEGKAKPGAYNVASGSGVTIRALLERSPGLPQVACFDTAMHRSNPPVAQMFALPAELTEAGVRRYGFHGLSYEYIASVLPQFDPAAARGRTVVLHLGNGASMCALHTGRSVASTMGFTAVDGLPMGTRCGAIDPGVMLYLMDERKMDARALEKLIYQQSGLLGVSGVSSDMRVLLESAEPRARLAVELFVYRIGRELGSLAAALGGVDALVFTAGIGEHAASIREWVCRQAAWLGVELDAKANAVHGPRLSTASSRVAAWVIPTNEELMIARHTRAVLQRTARNAPAP